jgi:hypothetical protein
MTNLKPLQMNKVFQYKVYKPTNETVINRVWQGDFEGDYPYNHANMWSQYWNSLGSPTTMDRYRKDSYTGTTSGVGFSCGGTNRLTVPSQMGIVSTGLNVPVVAIMGIFSYTSWSSATNIQYLFSYSLNVGAGLPLGYGIALNKRPGICRPSLVTVPPYTKLKSC